MQGYQEMLVWVGYTAEDDRRLAALWPHVEPRVEDIVAEFYRAILANPRAHRVFPDAASVERQKATLRRWIAELLQGPRDEAYVRQRERVGQVHVDVGLPSEYMFTSMNLIRRALHDIAHACLPEADFPLTCAAILRATDLDLALMTGRYVSGREERQRASLQALIVSHLPVTVLLLDEAGYVRAATRPGTRLFGERPVLDRPYQEALPTSVVEAADLVGHVARALTTGREIVLSRVDVVVDDQPRNFRITLVPLDDPGARLLLHLEELTDTVTAEARARRTESLTQLGALSAAVAHELRNPLAGISGALQVITRSLPDGDRRKPIMEKVEGQVRRLDALVTDLLQFARPTEARKVPLALAEAVHTAADTGLREHPGVELRVEGDAEVLADPHLLQHVLLNLFLNAAQAMEGQGKLRVRLSPGRVEVADSGPGVPPESRETLFQPFYTTRTRGTGLGLAICRKLMTAMNGEITLDQRPGEGARFVLTFPS